jgi:hypothetical protein
MFGEFDHESIEPDAGPASRGVGEGVEKCLNGAKRLEGAAFRSAHTGSSWGEGSAGCVARVVRTPERRVEVPECAELLR